MSTKEMTRFHLRLLEESKTSFQIYLIEEEIGMVPRIVAETSLGSRAASLKPLSASQADLDEIADRAEQAGQRFLGLDHAIEETAIETFAAFRNSIARGSIADAAFSYLMRKVVPLYEQGSIDHEDENFIILAQGKALNPGAPRGTPGGAGKPSRPRPKSRKKLKHDWF